MSLIQKTTLHSGINVITEEMPDVESCSVGVWVTTGSRDEKAEVNGVTHFIEHLLFKGTQRRTSLDISKEIESVGGVLNAFTSRENTCFYVKVLNKDLALAIDILSDIFMNSKFDRNELAKEKLVVLQEIKMVEDTPDDLIHDLFAEDFWKGHALGRSILGSKENIESIGRAEILGYFREHYGPGRVFITAAGGLKHKRVLSLVKKTFGSMTPGPVNKGAVAPASTPGVRLIKKDLEQAHMCLGVPAPPQPHPDRYKVYLLNTILGSGMSSRLFQEIREKRGLVYSVYSYLSLCRDAGSLVVYAGTSADTFTEVVGLILKEFRKLRKGVTKEELSNAKEQLKGGMLLGLETSDSRMSKLARDEIFFGKVVPVREIVKGIDRVTMREMEDICCRLLTPDRVTMVAMGRVSPRGLPKELKRVC